MSIAGGGYYIKYLKSYDLLYKASFCLDISVPAKSIIAGIFLYKFSPLFQFISVNVIIYCVQRDMFRKML